MRIRQWQSDLTIPAAIRARLRAYADRKGLTVPEATAALLDAGLRAHERAVQAGKARGATFTTADAQAAIGKRWAARRKKSKGTEDAS